MTQIYLYRRRDGRWAVSIHAQAEGPALWWGFWYSEPAVALRSVRKAIRLLLPKCARRRVLVALRGPGANQFSEQ